MSPSFVVRARSVMVSNDKRERGKKKFRKTLYWNRLKPRIDSIGSCVTTICTSCDNKRTMHSSTHCRSRVGSTPYKRSFPMSVSSAKIGKLGRSFRSFQSWHERIPGSVRPRTLERCPYERPCPCATKTSNGPSTCSDPTRSTVGRDRRKLLAPSRTRRAAGGK